MRRIILEFIGGSWDGRNLSNDSLDPAEVRLAVRKYLITDNATIGKEIRMPLDYTRGYYIELDGEADSTPHDGAQRYVVTDRAQVRDEVLVRFEFRPADESQQ